MYPLELGAALFLGPCADVWVFGPLCICGVQHQGHRRHSSEEEEGRAGIQESWDKLTLGDSNYLSGGYLELGGRKDKVW